MNKANFREKLNKATGYNDEKCKIVNDVIESHFIIGKNNKEKILNDFIDKLNIEKEEAEELYNKCVSILGNEFKSRIRHPFKSKKG